MNIITTISASLLCLSTIAQDTARLQPSFIYSGKEHPHRSKAFAASVKYAPEVITFSPAHKIFEYCYYYDAERICFGDDYRLLNDSTVSVNDVAWRYVKKDSFYLVSRQTGHTIHSALVRALMPFDYVTPEAVVSTINNDTLWYLDFEPSRQSGAWVSTIRLPVKQKTGKLYQLKNVDSPPGFLDKTLEDGLSNILLNTRNRDLCYGEPYINVVQLTFTVTKEGKIINIFDGNQPPLYCGYIIGDCILELSRITVAYPAKRKNKPVDVKMQLRLRYRAP